MSYIRLLDKELILMILKYLSMRDKLMLSSTCMRFRNIVEIYDTDCRRDLRMYRILHFTVDIPKRF